MYGEQIRVWKKEAVNHLKYYPGIHLDRLGKTVKNLRTADSPTKIYEQLCSKYRSTHKVPHKFSHSVEYSTYWFNQLYGAHCFFGS